MTLFLTTHYLEEADPCDRVAIVEPRPRDRAGQPRTAQAELGGQENIELAVREVDDELLAGPRPPDGRRSRGSRVITWCSAVDSAEAVLPSLLPLVGNADREPQRAPAHAR